MDALDVEKAASDPARCDAAFATASLDTCIFVPDAVEKRAPLLAPTLAADGLFCPGTRFLMIDRGTTKLASTLLESGIEDSTSPDLVCCWIRAAARANARLPRLRCRHRYRPCTAAAVDVAVAVRSAGVRAVAQLDAPVLAVALNADIFVVAAVVPARGRAVYAFYQLCICSIEVRRQCGDVG